MGNVMPHEQSTYFGELARLRCSTFCSVIVSACDDASVRISSCARALQSSTSLNHGIGV